MRLRTDKHVKIRTHELTSPEGVLLRFAIGKAGDRIAAFLIDFLLMMLVIIVFALLVHFSGISDGYVIAFAMVFLFVVRNFYFVFFELRWQGATPGKKRLKLRVIDRHGGPLRGDAVFVRNLLREVEFFLPMTAILAPQQLFQGSTGLAVTIALVWFIVFACMPLFNKDRLRIGDIVAGTIVVRVPKAQLLKDVGTDSVVTQRERAMFTFTNEELDVYGIYELQVLEDVLRRDDEGTLEQDVAAMVCGKISNKLGRGGEVAQYPVRFLRDFYAAQRARLEQKMLLGKRQEYKTTGARLREKKR